MLSRIMIARSALKPAELDLREHAKLSCRLFVLKQQITDAIKVLRARLEGAR